MENNNELVEAYKLKIEALELKNEAYQLKIEAQEQKIGALQYRLNNIESEYTRKQYIPKPFESSLKVGYDTDDSSGKKRGRKPKLRPDEVNELQEPVYNAIEKMLTGQGFNRATYRALTGILLSLYENGTATVSSLHEYIGGSRVTIVRHTTLLKKLGYVKYEGSRKKGNYVLTENGKAFLAGFRG